jgi:DNA-binding protein YbaB
MTDKQLERARAALARLEDDLARQNISAQDGSGLVEVRVDAKGRVIEVAINADALPHVGARELAGCFLRATRAAQEKAVRVVAERHQFLFGT